MTDDHGFIPRPQSWKTVRACNWLHEAHLIASVLEAQGIEARIPDAHMLGIRPDFATLFGGVRVLVRTEDYSRADAALAAAIFAVPDHDDDAPGEPGR